VVLGTGGPAVRGPELLTVTTPPAWMAAAVCAGVDPEVFFPEDADSTREAKAVCARCPVRAACVAYALATGERFGIWGGLNEAERRQRPRPDADAEGAGSPQAPSGRPAREVDPVVVERLVAGWVMPGATSAERAQAALGLARGGWGTRRIAARLGVHERQVHRWLTRSRTGAGTGPQPGPGPGLGRRVGAA